MEIRVTFCFTHSGWLDATSSQRSVRPETERVWRWVAPIQKLDVPLCSEQQEVADQEA
jgi:hypothetical protein